MFPQKKGTHHFVAIQFRTELNRQTQIKVGVLSSFDEGIDDAVMSNNIVLYIGAAWLVIYVMVVLGRFNTLDQRVSKINGKYDR